LAAPPANQALITVAAPLAFLQLIKVAEAASELCPGKFAGNSFPAKGRTVPRRAVRKDLRLRMIWASSPC
jgi:hypothetical protein